MDEDEKNSRFMEHYGIGAERFRQEVSRQQQRRRRYCVDWAVAVLCIVAVLWLVVKM